MARAESARKLRLELENDEVRLLQTLLSYDDTVPAAIREAATVDRLEGEGLVHEIMYRDADDLDLFMPKLYNTIKNAWGEADASPLFKPTLPDTGP